MLHQEARILAYDDKAFLGCVLSAYKDIEIEVGEVRLIDPLVGCWLLQPDRPATTFLGCLQILGLAREATSDLGTRQSVARDLALLSSLGCQLFRQLDAAKLWPVFYELELRILPQLAGMEMRGVGVDQGRLQALGHCLDTQLAELETKAHEVAGRQFNLGSHVQVRTLLFTELQLDIKASISVGKTAGGVKSTCELVLQSLEGTHPLPGLILQHRQVAKYRTTYVEGLLQHCRAGRVFTTWDQLAAATGRLTSVSPNLQGRTFSFLLSLTPVILAGIPKGEIEAGGRTVNMRSALISSDGFTFLCADFEQIEVHSSPPQYAV